jgi:hypothetical protein
MFKNVQIFSAALLVLVGWLVGWLVGCGGNSITSSTGGGGGIPVVTSGLMAQYEMLAGESVASLPDHSGNGNNATGASGVAPTIIPVTGGLTFSGIGGVNLPAALNSAVTVMAFLGWQSNPGGSVDFPNPIIGGSDPNHFQSFGILDNNFGPGGPTTYGQNSTNNFSLATRGGWAGQGVLSIVFGASPTGDQIWDNAENNLDETGPPAGSFGLQTDGFYYIGLYPSFSEDSPYYFHGEIYYLLFYDRALSAAEIAQNVQSMQLQMAARGVPATTPANASTSVDNNLIFEGDSLTAGFGMVPWPSEVVFNNLPNFNHIGLALAGERLSTINAYGNLTADSFYNPEAQQNFETVWAGTNDVYAGGPLLTPAAAANILANYCLQRKNLGWNVFVGSMISRDGEVSDANGKDLFNLSVRQNWQEFANGFVDTASTALGADGAYADTEIFQADGVHPTNYAVSNILVPLWQMSVNRYYGNRNFSSAATYTAAATAPIATTAGTFTVATAAGSPQNYATITVTALSPNMVTGRMVTVSGVSPSGYNGTYRIFSTIGTTQLTYVLPPSITSLADINSQGTVVSPQQQDADDYVVLNFGTGDFTLMTAVGYTGQQIHIKNINADASTIVPFGGTGASPAAETIDGASSLTIAPGATVVLQSVLVSPAAAGNNWITVPN